MMIDRFSTLDDLKGKDRSDPQKIIAVLDKVKRFSCFEVDNRMAGTMTWLCLHSGWIITRNSEVVKDDDGHGTHTRDFYPWTYVELTEVGRANLPVQP